LKPLTMDLGAAPGGWLKKAVTPATCSHAPIRQSQSAASADRQTMRSGGRFMPRRQTLPLLSGMDNAGNRYRNSSHGGYDIPK
ncbi:MAG TPA: hypothetical protein VNX46_19465, partial [Candidatus Acidoferrum sp.]|nr:hypothetical protein [Candidatus Acidoferrum sp.]